MRIAVVIEHFNPARGGAETYTAGLVRWLISQQHEVTLYTQDWSVEPAGLTLVAVPARGVSGARRYLSFSTTVSQLLSEADYDVIHSMARIVKQNVFHPHGGVTLASMERSLAASPTPLQRGLRKAARWLNTKSDIILELENIIYTETPPPRLIAVSSMVAEDMKRYYHVDESRIDVVYNGVDSKRFSPDNRSEIRAPLREELGIGDGEIVLLLVAHNQRLKGAEVFLRTIYDLVKRGRDNVRGVIVGSKSGDGVYSHLAAKMGLAERVHFCEASADIERFYASADVYLHPTFYDPMSLVVLEALASGLPSITTRFNGCSEIITDGVEGFSVADTRDVNSFAESVDALLDDSRRADMGAAARELALKFPLERNYEGIMQVYQKAEAEGAGPDITIRKEE
jgi:UDP-glucose:(heptosyl)LPS alpha-1,3-glucosyltransferase